MKEDGSWIDMDSNYTKINSPYNLRPRNKKNYYQTTRPVARNDKKKIDKNMSNLQSSIKSGEDELFTTFLEIINWATRLVLNWVNRIQSCPINYF